MTTSSTSNPTPSKTAPRKTASFTKRISELLRRLARADQLETGRGHLVQLKDGRIVVLSRHGGKWTIERPDLGGVVVSYSSLWKAKENLRSSGAHVRAVPADA